MANTWYIYLERNSTQAPCGTLGTHVNYDMNRLGLRTFGCYLDHFTDTEVMNQVLGLTGSLPPISYDSITYNRSADIVYLNDVLYYQPDLEITDYLDFVIQPYSNYTPDTAIEALISKLADISGMITNIFAKYGLIGYLYINTEFIKSGTTVIMRINLKQVT